MSEGLAFSMTSVFTMLILMKCSGIFPLGVTAYSNSNCQGQSIEQLSSRWRMPQKQPTREAP